MEHYLCPSSSAAIKRRFLSQPVTMNIGPSMLLSATSIITSDVHMATDLSLLVFYLYPKVSLFFFYCLLLWPAETCICFFISRQDSIWDCWVPTVSSKVISCFLVTHIGITSPWWKEAWGFSMSWQTLSTRNLGYWTIYSRLPRTGVIDMYCTRLVLSVSY